MNIKLEPHRSFGKAIVKVGRQGRLTYNYYMLVDVCERLYELPTEDAVEWVDYNICNLAPMGFDISFAVSARSIGHKITATGCLKKAARKRSIPAARKIPKKS